MEKTDRQTDRTDSEICVLLISPIWAQDLALLCEWKKAIAAVDAWAFLGAIAVKSFTLCIPLIALDLVLWTLVRDYDEGVLLKASYVCFFTSCIQ